MIKKINLNSWFHFRRFAVPSSSSCITSNSYPVNNVSAARGEESGQQCPVLVNSPERVSFSIVHCCQILTM